MTTPEVTDVKAALTAGLTELRLPTVRHCYEETARLAERETLSYERYLLQLVARECEDRQRKRIERLLHQSRIPAEKALSNFSLKRLPPKVALITKTLPEGEFLGLKLSAKACPSETARGVQIDVAFQWSKSPGPGLPADSPLDIDPA